MGGGRGAGWDRREVVELQQGRKVIEYNSNKHVLGRW